VDKETNVRRRPLSVFEEKRRGLLARIGGAGIVWKTIGGTSRGAPPLSECEISGETKRRRVKKERGGESSKCNLRERNTRIPWHKPFEKANWVASRN